jgi:tight adherence protein B
MGPLILIVFLLLFVISLISFVLVSKFAETRRKKNVAAVLRNAAGGEESFHEEPAILNSGSRQQDALTGILERFGLSVKLDKLLRQAGLEWSPARLVSMMAIAGAAGFLLGSQIRILGARSWSMAGLALLLAYLPYWSVKRKRAKRIAKFEEQFPAALDFLARSMRAGHAFSVSLELLATETEPPLKLEIAQLFNEQNLGAPLEVALQNLADRVPLLDVGFFVAAVTMQRESGGNLSEILQNLSYVIRERFRLLRQVRAASAHGRLAGQRGGGVKRLLRRRLHDDHIKRAAGWMHAADDVRARRTGRLAHGRSRNRITGYSAGCRLSDIRSFVRRGCGACSAARAGARILSVGLRHSSGIPAARGTSARGDPFRHIATRRYRKDAVAVNRAGAQHDQVGGIRCKDIQWGR